MKLRSDLQRLISPIAFIVTAWVLKAYVVESPERAAQVTRGLAGPSMWPDMMLWSIIFFGCVWVVQIVVVFFRALNLPVESAGSSYELSSDAQSTPFSIFIGCGVVCILLYGYFIPVIGFALATLLYLIIWCILGGIRKPLLLGPIGLLGTAVLLYLFVKLASMPLDRGQGVIGEFSIALYRMMGIY
jgi:putative tricarboxylic transport membrane protein